MEHMARVTKTSNQGKVGSRQKQLANNSVYAASPSFLAGDCINSQQYCCAVKAHKV